ncbi:MAG TPA: DUF1287 domain-containing protein [Opitutaceae bacterium]|nr:DUF1287 domain-containing protein [Opitutaceae bacterium]
MRQPRRILFPILLLAGGVLLPRVLADPVVDAARSQVGITTGYDPAYRQLAYPGGDVPLRTGVCCDVVVRALRTAYAFDLQRAVHEDMSENFPAYPNRWGLKKPDRNIDHRRVPNLQTYFVRRGWSLATTDIAVSFLPGDIVTWDLGRGLSHIGVVSDRRSSDGAPLVIHNIGNGAQEEDVLRAWSINGHFRPVLPAAASPSRVEIRISPDPR